MNIDKIPNSGSFEANKWDRFTWKKSGSRSIMLFKEAECENPEYEAEVTFPDGVIDINNMDEWEISIGKFYNGGGEMQVHRTYIDQFDALLYHFLMEYGEKDQIII